MWRSHSYRVQEVYFLLVSLRNYYHKSRGSPFTAFHKEGRGLVRSLVCSQLPRYGGLQGEAAGVPR